MPCDCSFIDQGNSYPGVYFNSYNCNDVVVPPSLASEPVCSVAVAATATAATGQTGDSVVSYHEQCPDGLMVSQCDCLVAANAVEGDTFIRISTMDSQSHSSGCSIIHHGSSTGVYFNEYDCNDVVVSPSLAAEPVCSGPAPTVAPSTSNNPSAAPSTSNQSSAWTVPRYYKLSRGKSCPEDQRALKSNCLEAVRALKGGDRTVSHLVSIISRISP